LEVDALGDPNQKAQNHFFLVFFLRGTFPPARRASDNPIAMACFRLVTFFPERPLRRVPLLRSRIARLTFCAAFRPYLAIRILLAEIFLWSGARLVPAYILTPSNDVGIALAD
jgi:hypothetical protein